MGLGSTAGVTRLLRKALPKSDIFCLEEVGCERAKRSCTIFAYLDMGMILLCSISVNSLLRSVEASKLNLSFFGFSSASANISRRAA